MKYPDIPLCINTSDNDIDLEFYIPCLKWANRYDRGVGYFTSGWIEKNSHGMAEFAEHDGHARWIISPILDEQDYLIINSVQNMQEVSHHFQSALEDSVDQLAQEIEKDVKNALGWLIYDGILTLRFAIPTKKLADGNFHDKFGIFYDAEDNCVSFAGSINDSANGFCNYESIKIFKSWEGTKQYIDSDISRFERLWDNSDENLWVMECSEAIRRKLIQLRTKDRPYSHNKQTGFQGTDLWKHQDEAINAFLVAKHGILEMATGTGKTRTAIRIISTLMEQGIINRVVISMHGNDLLKQWEKEVLSQLNSEIRVFKYFDSIYKELPAFLLCKNKCVLIISRDENRLAECFDRLESRIKNVHSNTLLLFDEVHGLGSETLRKALTGKLSKYMYRLGLSATPNREFDELGNAFIRDEIGPIIYQFSLEDAIRKGILCEFSYIPIDYELLQEEKQKKRSIIASYAAKKKRGELVKEEDMYRDLARVNKTSLAKLPLFNELISKEPELLERCIIFVETREYGIEVQNILINGFPNFHTYYGEDDKDNLNKFATGQLDCLITCKKISEGVDIKSVKSIILFSSDKGQLVTTQRIGRSLRIDPSDPQKRATVVDFICRSTDTNDDNSELNADEERCQWLTGLSEVRRQKNETL